MSYTPLVLSQGRPETGFGGFGYLSSGSSGASSASAGSKSPGLGFAGAVDPLLSILGLLGNWGMSLYSANVNKQQQQQQNDFQRQLIHEQNEYNSPSAQLNRLLAAGVPYNTAMQSLVGSAVGPSTQPMSGQAAPYTPFSPPSLQDSMAIQSASDQHDLAQSQVRLNEAEAYSKDPTNPMNVSQRELQDAQKFFTDVSSRHELRKIGLTNAEITVAQQQGRLLMNNADQALYDALIRRKDYLNYDTFKKLNFDNLAAQTGKTVAELWHIAVTTGHEIDKMDAEAYAARALGRFHHSSADEKDMWNQAYKPYAGNIAFGETMGKLYESLIAGRQAKLLKFELRKAQFYSSRAFLLNEVIVDDLGKLAGAAMSIGLGGQAFKSMKLFKGSTAPIGFRVGSQAGFQF